VICTQFAGMRALFTDGTTATTGAINLTYHAGSPATITRVGGNFGGGGDGFAPGMYVTIAGTVSNNKRVQLSRTIVVLNTILTLEPGANNALVDEGPVSSTLTGFERDLDGHPPWPVDLLRAGGFSGGITGVGQPILEVPFTMSCNGGAADSVAGTDQYDWYISQRTDDPARQMLAVSAYAPVGVPTYSGSVVVGVTALGVARAGLASAASLISHDQMVLLFKHVTAYCRRRSDGAVQYVNVLDYALS